MSSLARVAMLAAMAIGGLSVTAPAASAATPAPSAQDIQYLQQAHQVNMAEIAGGKLAQQKGNSQTVKNLGAKFVTDHMNLDHMLMPVAQQLHVNLPSAPNAQQQAVAARLKKLSGKQFDTRYVQSQFAGHTQALLGSQTEIAKGTNPDAINVARQSAPVIESHRNDLRAAAQSLGIPLSPGATPAPNPSATATAGPPQSPHQPMHS